MTKKETEVQLALGTLPLWRRLELGWVKVKEDSFPPAHNIMQMSCENMTVSYVKGYPSARKYAIDILIEMSKRKNDC